MATRLNGCSRQESHTATRFLRTRNPEPAREEPHNFHIRYGTPTFDTVSTKAQESSPILSQVILFRGKHYPKIFNVYSIGYAFDLQMAVFYFLINFIHARCWWRTLLRHCATSRKVSCSIPDGVIAIFHRHNPSDRAMALGSTQPLTEMSTRSISCG